MEEKADVDAAPVKATMMFAAARALALGDDAVLGKISDTETEGTRGRVSGSVRHLSGLPGGNADVRTIPFYGDSCAGVAHVGGGSSHMDALITDEIGNTICTDVSYSDKLACRFVPVWNGHFHLTPQNQPQAHPLLPAGALIRQRTT